MKLIPIVSSNDRTRLDFSVEIYGACYSPKILGLYKKDFTALNDSLDSVDFDFKELDDGLYTALFNKDVKYIEFNKDGLEMDRITIKNK